MDNSRSLIVRRSSNLAAMSSNGNRLVARALDDCLEHIPIFKILDEKLEGPRLEEYPDGSSYFGQFKGKIRHGFGTFSFANGDKYEGSFKEGDQHGNGTFTSVDGDEYIGEWRRNKRHGQGTENYADGNVYIGQFKRDDRHGYGTYTWHPDGDLGEKSYQGDWEDGVIHCQAPSVCANFRVVVSGIGLRIPNP